MTKQNDELDEILIGFFNNAEVDVHSENFHDGVVVTTAHTKAKQQILNWHNREVERILHSKGEDDNIESCKNDGNQS